MTRAMTVLVTGVALSLAAVFPAEADDRSQLIAQAGLTPAEAAGMSLSDIAVHKFNRDARRDDVIVLSVNRSPVPSDPVAHAQLIAAAGRAPGDAPGMTLTEDYVYKINRDDTGHERPGVTVSSRGAIQADPNRDAQLIAGVGLAPDEIRGMTLSGVALIKYYRETDSETN